MTKSISLDAITKLVEKKTGKKVKLQTYNATDDYFIGTVKLILDKNVNFSKIIFSEDGGIDIIDNRGRNIANSLHCLLFDEQLVDGKVLVEGIKNGVLILDNEIPTEEDLAFLLQLEGVSTL